MVSSTYAYRQRSPAPPNRRRMRPAAARAIEIKLPLESLKADRPLCRILILTPDATTAERRVVQVRAAPNTHEVGSASAGGRFHRGPLADEEPTWEDAEWQ